VRAVIATVAIAVLIAGCGSSATEQRGRAMPRQLVIDAAVVDSSSGRAFLRGLQLELVSVNSQAGSYGLRLEIVSPGNTLGAVLAAARAVASQPRTILYVGDLSASDTATASDVLSAAGLPQISVVAAPASPAGATRTLLELVPDSAINALALVKAARFGSVCSRVVMAWRLPLTSPREQTTCRLTAGPALSGLALAQEQGVVAAELLVAAERQLGSSGDDRQQVMHALRSARLAKSPLGPIAFAANGELSAYDYTLDRVALGHPALLRVLPVN
jgi:ABC-type branched-subunit amino acid transport system substrate-binding protein